MGLCFVGMACESTAHSSGIMAIILVNLVLLGIEVDVAASLAYGETPVYFNEINMLVVGIFMMEVLLKLIALGVRGYFCAKEKWWNIFDFAIVSLSVVELILEFLVMTISGNMDSSHLRILRFARFARTLRGVRVVRLLRYIGSLRTIVFSIISTMGSLFWTLVLLLMIFYCFSVIITQSVTDFCRLSAELGEPHNCQELTMYWATVPESMLTLFLAISGGLSWKEALNPLRRVGVIAFASVILYVVITIFAILNVVTGVFCNTAIESAGADKEIAIMKQMKKQDAQMETLREIFTEIDIDCSNQISLAELKEALKAPKLRSFMSSLQISTEDAWTLFMTVDADGSGEISLDEFVAGCMQLQGPAKGLQAR
ncbi:unnamed protein product [Effrenium voratum]|uniref:EF-hand domain-containing protein n=1 Tax=Effrenium voratum TaxID=2562239 RepID=A0AA36NEP6_9DINO|nr:unnamed protein product [Effrenium voratum]